MRDSCIGTQIARSEFLVAGAGLHSVRMADTRSDQRNPERLELEDLTSIQPGLARLMPEVGHRFWKCYYAARAQNWALAAWQLGEMRKLLRLGEVTRPRYTADLESFIQEDVEPLLQAMDARDLSLFERLYRAAVDAANDLHRRWNKAFIVWKLPDHPPPDLDLTPVD